MKSQSPQIYFFSFRNPIRIDFTGFLLIFIHSSISLTFYLIISIFAMRSHLDLFFVYLSACVFGHITCPFLNRLCHSKTPEPFHHKLFFNTAKVSIAYLSIFLRNLILICCSRFISHIFTKHATKRNCNMCSGANICLIHGY